MLFQNMDNNPPLSETPKAVKKNLIFSMSGQYNKKQQCTLGNSFRLNHMFRLRDARLSFCNVFYSTMLLCRMEIREFCEI